MDQQISSELPPVQSQNPSPEAMGSVGHEALTEVAKGRAIETGAPLAQNPLAQPAAPQAAVPVAPSASHPMYAQPSAQQLSSMPTIADDTDLIEKEWVTKAKEIVERTKQDPYMQNKEVEKFKADYLKKRYNKDIKLTDD